jgi:fumarylpyruvate hydrolase
VFDPCFTANPVGRGTGLGLSPVGARLRSPAGGPAATGSVLDRDTRATLCLPATESRVPPRSKLGAFESTFKSMPSFVRQAEPATRTLLEPCELSSKVKNPERLFHLAAYRPPPAGPIAALHNFMIVSKSSTVEPPGAPMFYVIPVPPAPMLPVNGGGMFPVRRIYCAGRNYARHAREMGQDPDRQEPFFFSKPGDTILQNHETLIYPRKTSNLHYEVELVVAIGKAGAEIDPEIAFDHVFGYAVGLDMTRRDLQQIYKETRQPWDLAKGFDHAAPCTAIHPVAEVGHPRKGSIWLKVNGTIRQDGDLGDMIWPVPEIISHLSAYVDLAPGDLIFTGTPDGVGPVNRGDKLIGHIDRLKELEITVA